MGEKVHKETNFMNLKVKIYNYPGGVAFSTPRDHVECQKLLNRGALTADQVKKSFNYGAQFFGPLQGSP